MNEIKFCRSRVCQVGTSLWFECASAGRGWKKKKITAVCYFVSLISCPFDFVNVFDGPDNESALIGTYCGQQRNLVLYSTDHFLLVTFTTLKRTADSQNRGFIGFFEFSEGFVKLGSFVCLPWPCQRLWSNQWNLIVFCFFVGRFH